MGMGVEGNDFDDLNSVGKNFSKILFFEFGKEILKFTVIAYHFIDRIDKEKYSLYF